MATLVNLIIEIYEAMQPFIKFYEASIDWFDSEIDKIQDLIDGLLFATAKVLVDSFDLCFS